MPETNLGTGDGLLSRMALVSTIVLKFSEQDNKMITRSNQS